MRPDLAERQQAIEQVCRQFHVLRLELFGSGVSDQFRPDQSDLDFLVEFEPLPRGAYADAFFGLLEALQALFERPVDLVVASSISNPYFQQSVDRARVLVFAA